jgi:hypothetical protein
MGVAGGEERRAVDGGGAKPWAPTRDMIRDKAPTFGFQPEKTSVKPLR